MVKKLLAVGIILLLVGMSIPSTGTTIEKSSLSFDGKTLYVGGSGEGNYTRIQDAIDNSSDGDTVFVYNGTYIENLVVNKSINLIGENKNSTVIDGNNVGDVIIISNENVTVFNFTIQNGKFGIRLFDSKHNIICNNKITCNTDEGIDLLASPSNKVIKNIIFSNEGAGIRAYSSNNTIKNNIIYSNNAVCIGGSIDLLSGANDNLLINNTISSNNYDGISIELGSRNTLVNNTISSNMDEGIYIGYQSNNNIIEGNKISQNKEMGVRIFRSNNHTIISNTIISNQYNGIFFDESNYNTIQNNILSDNNNGIRLLESSNNTFYHNNFINNSQNANDKGNNFWDNGYPSGGNYWDDYTGEDADGDGIGDTPYPIPPSGENEDRYPLMEPYEQTELEIGFISGGLFKIKAEIRNVGRYNATEVNWTIKVIGKLVPIFYHISGEIPIIIPGESEIISTGFLLGLGRYKITVTAEASNAEKVTKTIDGFIFLFFIIIR